MYVYIREKEEDDALELARQNKEQEHAKQAEKMKRERMREAERRRREAVSEKISNYFSRHARLSYIRPVRPSAPKHNSVLMECLTKTLESSVMYQIF